MPSGLPGQVDFPAGQVSCLSHLPDGQGPRQVVCQLNLTKISRLRLAQGEQNLRAACPMGKLEFKFFSSPAKYKPLSVFFAILQENKSHSGSCSNCTKLVAISWFVPRLTRGEKVIDLPTRSCKSRYFTTGKSICNCFVIRSVSFFFARLPQFHNVV